MAGWVRAPRLRGRSWVNAGGAQLSLEQFRGRFVLLDFWTFACVNCLHVIEELRPLEARFADILVPLGVHSPKFEHEGDAQAVIDAVERYGVRHPVLDDPDRATWDAYAVKAWPTLVLIDPLGYIVFDEAGEGHVPRLTTLIEELAEEHRADGTLRLDGEPVAVAGPGAQTSPLRFPGGLLELPADRYPGGGLLVSDTSHHQLVVLAGEEFTEKARIGTGERGLVDGDPSAARFDGPLGAALLPADVAGQVGYDVVVTDSVSHALRGLRLADLTVVTLTEPGPRPELSTPWDARWWAPPGPPASSGRIVVALAGVHRLASFDPRTGELGILAGTGREGLVDGSAERSWFAQPSGLAVSRDGGTLWVADAETSALRRLDHADDGSLQVRTVIGEGLFEFGLHDGPATEARLQHPLAVAVLPDDSVAIADTFNGAVRRYDPVTDEVTTLETGLAEPSALVPEQDPSNAAGGVRLVVAEAAGHRVVRLPLPVAVQTPAPTSQDLAQRPVVDLAPGPVGVTVAFTPPPGQHLDDRFGDPTRLDISVSPPGVLRSGGGPGTGLTRAIDLDERISGGRIQGVLRVAVQAAACDVEGGDAAACHLFRRQWEIPFRLVPGTARDLHLEFAAEPF